MLKVNLSLAVLSILFLSSYYNGVGLILVTIAPKMEAVRQFCFGVSLNSPRGSQCSNQGAGGRWKGGGIGWSFPGELFWISSMLPVLLSDGTGQCKWEIKLRFCCISPCFNITPAMDFMEIKGYSKKELNIYLQFKKKQTKNKPLGCFWTHTLHLNCFSLSLITSLWIQGK